MKVDSKKVLKLDLGGDLNPAPGFIVLPRNKLEEYPWKYKSNSITLLSAANVVEKINPVKRGFINWLNEAWRVLKVDGQMRIITPYAGSMGYFADPTNINPCNAQTWFYFDPKSTTGLYNAYEPAPWHVEQCFFQSDGNMEVLLTKLEDKKEYHRNGRIKYA